MNIFFNDTIFAFGPLVRNLYEPHYFVRGTKDVFPHGISKMGIQSKIGPQVKKFLPQKHTFLRVNMGFYGKSFPIESLC